MKKILFLLSLLSLTSAYAQDVINHPMTEGTRTQVQGTFQSMASHKVILADFQQTKFLTSLGRQFKSTGKLIFEAKMGILWEILTPFPSVTIITENEYIQKSPSGRVSKISGAENKTFQKFSGVIQSVFKGNYLEVEKEFKIFFLPGVKGSWTVGLEPKDQTLRGAIKLIILQGTLGIEDLQMLEPSGDKVQYRFSSISYPEVLGENEKSKFKP